MADDRNMLQCLCLPYFLDSLYTALSIILRWATSTTPSEMSPLRSSCVNLAPSMEFKRKLLACSPNVRASNQLVTSVTDQLNIDLETRSCLLTRSCAVSKLACTAYDTSLVCFMGELFVAWDTSDVFSVCGVRNVSSNSGGGGRTSDSVDSDIGIGESGLETRGWWKRLSGSRNAWLDSGSSLTGIGSRDGVSR